MARQLTSVSCVREHVHGRWWEWYQGNGVGRGHCSTASSRRPAGSVLLSRLDRRLCGQHRSQRAEGSGTEQGPRPGRRGLTRSPGCPSVRPRSGPSHRAPAHVGSSPDSSEESFPACSKTQTGQKGLGSHPTVISHANDTSRVIWETLLPLCSHV